MMENSLFPLDAVSLDVTLFTGEPQQWCCSTMCRQKIRRDRRLVICVELRPIEGHPNLGAVCNDVGHPAAEQCPDIHGAVSDQPVHLLHRVLLPLVTRKC